MPFPVAHALIGAGVVAASRPHTRLGRDWKKLLAGAVLAVSPDLDYALNYLPGLGGGWHHGFTHSFFFGILLGFAVALFFQQPILSHTALWALVTISHPILDYLFTDSRGLELFWPLSDKRYLYGMRNPIDYSWRTGSLWDAAADMLKISVAEFVVYGLIFCVILWLKGGVFRRPDKIEPRID